MKNGEMIENILGGAAAVAGYKLLKKTINKENVFSGIIENVGWETICITAGLWIGEKVKDKIHRVRLEIQKTKKPSEQEKSFSDWMEASVK